MAVQVDEQFEQASGSARAPGGALRALRRAILLISLPFGMLGFVLPIYGRRVGADAVQIGLFFSAFSLMTVVARPLVGAWLDRHGRRPLFLAGLAAYAASMFAFAWPGGVWSIIAARTVQGLASGMTWLAASAIVADVAPAHGRGQAFGGVDEANHQGAIAGTLIGFTVLGFLDIALGWSVLFLAYGVVSVAALVLALRTLPETHAAPARRVTAPLVWSRPWILLLLVTAVTGASFAMLAPILMIYLQAKLGVGVAELAAAYLPAALVWAVLPSRLGGLADRFGRKPLMVLGLVVAAASSFVVPGLASLAALAAVWALQELCYAAGDPAERALVADLTGGDQRGRAYGLYTLAAGLGAVVGPLAGGWLYESAGPQAPFYANGILLALCAVVLVVWLKVPAPAEA